MPSGKNHKEFSDGIALPLDAQQEQWSDSDDSVDDEESVELLVTGLDSSTPTAGKKQVDAIASGRVSGHPKSASMI